MLLVRKRGLVYVQGDEDGAWKNGSFRFTKRLVYGNVIVGMRKQMGN